MANPNDQDDDLDVIEIPVPTAMNDAFRLLRQYPNDTAATAIHWPSVEAKDADWFFGTTVTGMTRAAIYRLQPSWYAVAPHNHTVARRMEGVFDALQAGSGFTFGQLTHLDRLPVRTPTALPVTSLATIAEPRRAGMLCCLFPDCRYEPVEETDASWAAIFDHVLVKHYFPWKFNDPRLVMCFPHPRWYVLEHPRLSTMPGLWDAPLGPPSQANQQPQIMMNPNPAIAGPRCGTQTSQ